MIMFKNATNVSVENIDVAREWFVEFIHTNTFAKAKNSLYEFYSRRDCSLKDGGEKVEVWVNGEMVGTIEPCDWRGYNNVCGYLKSINKWDNARSLIKAMDTKKPTKKEEKKVETMNVDAILASLNTIRVRNAELINEVSKGKREMGVANDEIAYLKKMLALANEKIASLEKDNEELAIYKVMVEEETKIAA